MATRKSLFDCFSGKLGNVVLYTRFGKGFVRMCRTRVNNPRTELQMFYRARLRRVNTFYSAVRQTPLAEIWRIAAREVNTGANVLFNKMNIRAFNGEKGIFYDRLHFTAGSLPLAEEMRVRRLSEREVLLTWKNIAVLNKDRKWDRLLVIVMMENDLFDVILPKVPGSMRWDEEAVVCLPEGTKEVKYLYCAFVSGNWDKCSDNQFLEIPDSAESVR